MEFLFVLLIGIFIIIVYSILDKFSSNIKIPIIIKEYNDIDVINMLKLYEIDVPPNSKFGFDNSNDKEIEYNISIYVKPWINQQPNYIKDEIFDTIFQIFKKEEAGKNLTELSFESWILFMPGRTLCEACLFVFEKYKKYV